MIPSLAALTFLVMFGGMTWARDVLGRWHRADTVYRTFR